jgi:hypothetical protein
MKPRQECPRLATMAGWMVQALHIDSCLRLLDKRWSVILI